MTRTPLVLLGLVLPALALSACMQRPPNNTTAEGQAFYACDRAAIDQTADLPDLIPQVRERESIRRECLASNNIPPLPGAKFVEAPVVLAPLPAAPGAPRAPVVPDSQNYQPPPIIQPPPS